MLNRLVSELRYRLRRLVKHDVVERELDAEVEFHIERETEQLMSSGMPRVQAERQARASFGGVERFKEETREAHGAALLESVGHDVRYAWRGLRARKSFTIGILLTLGLGIGANAAMFGVLDRVLLRPPAMLRDPSTVHRLYRRTVEDGQTQFDRNLAFATYLDLKREATAFSDIAAFQTNTFAIGDSADVNEVRVTMASANYFDFFDARPALGRFFTAAEDSIPAGAAVVVLGYDYWKSHFDGRNVVGEQLRVGRLICTVIGVAPRNFAGVSDQAMPAAYIPITTYAFARQGKADYPMDYGWSWLEVVARRKANVSIEAATVSATSAFIASWRAAQSRDARWGSSDKWKVSGVVAPIQIERGPQAGRDSRAALWVGGVALIVLLIACANVANLMLARAVSRRREIALRLALGVSRARLTRQLLTESALLATAGGLVGLVVAQWGGATIRRLFLPPEFGDAVLTDARTLAFTAVATFSAALVTGLAPAWNAGRADVVATLKSGGRQGGERWSPLRAGLLVFQAALSVLLLVGAGLFVRSLRNARDVRLGYDTDSVLVTMVNLRGVKLDATQLAVLMPRFHDVALSVPGVTSAALAGSTPFASNDQRGITVPGVDSVRRKGRFLIQFAAPGYFSTMGTRIRRGRALNENDRLGSERVAVVSEGMARVLWPGRNAIGMRFQLDAPGDPWLTIVGVAEDIRLRSFVDAREFTYYVPAEQYPDIAGALTLFIRVRGQASDFVGAVRTRLQQELPAPAYVNVRALSRLVDPNFRAWRFAATMFVAFGALALLLAAVGLYSLVAYDVAQRLRDVSVRIALGASRAQVVRHVVGAGLRLVTVGIVLGMAAAAWAAPRAESLMFKQQPRDPMVFVTVGVTLLLIGTLAALLPALRAARVDPAMTLRAE